MRDTSFCEIKQQQITAIFGVPQYYQVLYAQRDITGAVFRSFRQPIVPWARDKLRNAALANTREPPGINTRNKCLNDIDSMKCVPKLSTYRFELPFSLGLFIYV